VVIGFTEASANVGPKQEEALGEEPKKDECIASGHTCSGDYGQGKSDQRCSD
jgi:hypothetical protein